MFIQLQREFCNGNAMATEYGEGLTREGFHVGFMPETVTPCACAQCRYAALIRDAQAKAQAKAPSWLDDYDGGVDAFMAELGDL